MWNSLRRLQRIVVIHANHAQELRDAADVQAALGALQAAGTTLLNQSVLLRGVNDSVAALEELSVALFESGVLPYYLHVLDPVRGAAHFDVPEDEARQLHAGADSAPARIPRAEAGAGDCGRRCEDNAATCVTLGAQTPVL